MTLCCPQIVVTKQIRVRLLQTALELDHGVRQHDGVQLERQRVKDTVDQELQCENNPAYRHQGSLD